MALDTAVSDWPQRPMRFHWSLSQAGQPLRRSFAATVQTGVPPFEAQLALCRRAEECGIDSMLMAIGFSRPDPLVLSTALARQTSSVKFMVACRAGLVSPVTFANQIMTLSAISRGRVHVNMVVGHTPHELGYYGDFLDHDSRFARVGEFVEICRGLWSGPGPMQFEGDHYRVEGESLFEATAPWELPEIYIGGSSTGAVEIATRLRCSLWSLARPPAHFAQGLGELLLSGGDAGVLVSLIARQSTDGAVRAAEELVAPFGDETRAVHLRFANASDSVGFRSTYSLADRSDGPWLGSCLWTGAVPYLGAPAVALVGSYDDVARALMDYRRAGASQFLFMGWPDIEEMARFGGEILPRVRELDALEAGELVTEGSGR